MNKSATIILIICTLWANYSFGQVTEKGIVGNWYSEEMDQSTIQIYLAKDGAYYGKIIKSPKPDHIGAIIFHQLRFNEKEQEWSGTIRQPKKDISINAKVTMVSKDKLKLVGTKLIITKTFYLSKVL
ncbi:MAG: DUF2147 domain-containing protein [Leadbetterella sp.]